MRPIAPVCETIRVGARDLPVWPKDQAIKGRGDQVIAMTTFEDAPSYHPALIEKVLGLYENPTVKRMCSVSSAGTKIHGIGDWGLPEADLVPADAAVVAQPVVDVRARWKLLLGRERHGLDRL